MKASNPIINYCIFYVTMFSPIALVHFSLYKSLLIHNPSVSSDVGLTLETSAVRTL